MSPKLLLVVTMLGSVAALAEPVPPGSDEDIRARLVPFGEVCRASDCAAGGAAAASSGGGAMTGEQVYNQYCGTCHAAGVAGAPLLGNAEAWQPRIAQGMDTLWDHTLNGLNAMPAKGTCMNCSDEELRAAMEHMVEAAQ
jgi:cytochrome c5